MFNQLLLLFLNYARYKRGAAYFSSIGQFHIDIPKAEAHTLDITLTLTVLKDNSLSLEVKVGDNEPIVQTW